MTGTPRRIRQTWAELDERLLSGLDVARLLNIHPNTVRRLGDLGAIPYVRVLERGDRRYRFGDVRAYLARLSGNSPGIIRRMIRHTK